MKKIIVSLLLFVFVIFGLAGCKENTPLTVMVPIGAPAISQIYMQENNDYSIDIISGVDPLVAAFGSMSHDFIFAPTNLGAKLYNNEIDYVFIAAVTFGNYYLVSKESDFTIQSLEGKEIIVFGQNATSDIILNYILEENEINASLTYVADVTSANAEFIADNNKIIMTAEPMLSILANSVTGFNIIDLQSEYQKITGEDSYPQAGVFAKGTLTDKQINKFLDDLEASVNQVNLDLEATALKAVELDYGFSESVLIMAIPNSNIDFKIAKEVKSDLERYFNIILDINEALIGGKLPDDNFYN